MIHIFCIPIVSFSLPKGGNTYSVVEALQGFEKKTKPLNVIHQAVSREHYLISSLSSNSACALQIYRAVVLQLMNTVASIAPDLSPNPHAPNGFLSTDTFVQGQGTGLDSGVFRAASWNHERCATSLLSGTRKPQQTVQVRDFRETPH